MGFVAAPPAHSRAARELKPNAKEASEKTSFLFSSISFFQATKLSSSSLSL